MLLLNKIFLGDAKISQKGQGFTLMEVLVALSVLLVGVTSVGYFYRVFMNMEASERASARQILAGAKFVEMAIANPLACADTSYVVPDSFGVNLFVESRNLPGVKKLMQLNVVAKVDSVEWKNIRPALFGRIVFCK